MQHIINDHEEVRKFVEKETGGFVEIIEAQSRSIYEPTRDSIEGEEGKSPQDAYKERFLTLNRLNLKPYPTFIPKFYEASYKVTVGFHGGSFMECAVLRAGDALILNKGKIGMRW